MREVLIFVGLTLWLIYLVFGWVRYFLDDDYDEVIPLTILWWIFVLLFTYG